MEEYNKILWDGIDESNSPAEKKKAKAAFQEFLLLAGVKDDMASNNRGYFRFGILAVALSMSLSFMIAWFLFNGRDLPSWQEVSTRPGESTQVVLADNTVVTLNGNSTIVYPSGFSGRCRQIYFTGEGYFEVQADAKHPFDIITNDAQIRVYGTKFNLKSYSDDNVLSVGLDEGNVQFVGDAGVADKVVVEMVPGDNISYNKGTGVLEKEYSPEGSGLWRKGQYYFKNEPLMDIARDMERIFGVRVLIEKEELLNTHYYMALVNGETVDDFIRILSMDKSIKVSKTDNTIIIK